MFHLLPSEMALLAVQVICTPRGQILPYFPHQTFSSPTTIKTHPGSRAAWGVSANSSPRAVFSGCFLNFLCVPFPPTPLLPNNNSAAASPPSSEFLRGPAVAFVSRGRLPGNRERRAAVEPCGCGEVSCNCKFEAFCFDVVKKRLFRDAGETELGSDLKEGQAGWFLILCVLPRWIPCSLATQASTFVEIF